MRPCSTPVSPAIARSSVLLPLPLGPSRTKNSPSPTSSETSVTTGESGYLFVTWSSVIDIGSAAYRPGGDKVSIVAVINRLRRAGRRFGSLPKQRPPPYSEEALSRGACSANQSESDATFERSSGNTIPPRRFCWRPAAVSLLATGAVLPLPTVLICDASTPRSNNAACTDCARRSDRPWLYSSLPTLSV